jgi:Ca2+/Na+ antiporter
MSTPSLWQLAKNSVFLWVGLLFVPIGAVFICVAVSMALEERAFANRGETAQATVIDKSLEKADFDNNPSTRYIVRYRFETSSGAQVEQTREVSVDEWEQLAPGSILPVRFLPETPIDDRRADDSTWAGVAAFLTLGLITAAVGIALLVYAVREISRQRRLWRTGTTVPALVTGIAASSTVVNGVQQWEIRYSYTDLAGRKHEGRSNCMPGDEARQWRHGDRGLARFDPNATASSIWLGNSNPARGRQPAIEAADERRLR